MAKKTKRKMINWLKGLIDDKDDSNLKDAMAAFFCIIASGVTIYTTIIGDNATRLTVLLYLFGTIATLMGIKEGGKAINKDNGTTKKK